MTDKQHDLRSEFHEQTAKISWLELQRFFAQGKVLYVDSKQDLIEVAMIMAQDKAPELDALMKSGAVAAATDEQARQWHAEQAQLWSVVVAPFVLVQSIKE